MNPPFPEMIQMRTGGNIVLVGMPGVGKSTIGVLLAERLGYGFLDTDILMQTLEGRTLQKIIAYRGLDGFRRIEEKTILSLSITSHVIATGGSVVYSIKAMEHLKQRGWVCYLDIAPQLLRDRLDNIDTRGIVMAPGQTIESLYRERYPLYMQYADATVASGNLTPSQVLKKIDAALADRSR
jgi:shikimate kinase